MSSPKDFGVRRLEQMRAQVKELGHAADRTLDPELRRRLEAKIHRLREQCERSTPTETG
ncbi:hypothetical protein DWB77_00680 [Streptomyces hundungensis]|uniref:Small hydrophilic protein n=1 Tax=Streptomyces hundungensis TaxID=1077946 RepID=A0A387HCU3_9ACTN|nr:DUF6381 family protein [Streptomyces hundungensis]AYG78572.1 hypothetical protein DWB77_00680 [Streptomyces hundungensis]